MPKPSPHALPKSTSLRQRRNAHETRKIMMTPGTLKHAEGSCLIEFGDTKVLCTASVEESVPFFLKGKGSGWITAEYGMLPRSTQTRMEREATRGKASGRTLEIQRLIGRSLRSIVDLPQLGERQIKIDCDVIQADGGTRTAAISGGYVALVQAIHWLKKNKKISTLPVLDSVAALSAGIVKGETLLDLDYSEDSNASVDANFVMRGNGDWVEIQATAEQQSFSTPQLTTLLNLAAQGIRQIMTIQHQALESVCCV